MGFASCDRDETIAFGLKTIDVTGMRDAADKTVLEAANTGAELILIGLPIRTDGIQGEKAEKSRAFAKMVNERCPVKTELVDERFSTMHAHKLLNETGISGRKRKRVIDTLSAQLILQSYIDAKKNKRN